MEVCEKQCKQCLFGKGRIVSGKRMLMILQDCRKRDTHFVCHKHTAAHGTSNVMCRGFYETQPPTQMLRIAERFNMVTFVPEPEPKRIK